jgi:hypothetical protein
MNQTITYTPVYVGLLLSLWLAVVCNTFLDALYGMFAIEVLIWSPMLALTSWIGWRQRFQPWPSGQKIRKSFMVVAFAVFILVFLPLWFIPRGVVYFLAAVQAANNSQPLTRKNLYYGIVIAVAMVMFASAHMRAQWPMLFYVLPFLIVVVFTLIAEQVSHQAAESRTSSLGRTAQGREWVAIVSASGAILLLAAMLYALVPQASWRQLEWRFGAPAAGTDHPGDGESAAGLKKGDGTGPGGSVRLVWTSPGDMRATAKQTWMPRWQASVIMRLADLSEAWSGFWEPKQQKIQEWLDALWKSLKSIFDIRQLLLLMALALLIAWLVFVREIRPLAWLRTRMDYLRFCVLKHDGRGANTAIVLYRALERLFAYYNDPRPATYNTWEYLKLLRTARSSLRADLALLTLAFEAARYGRETGTGNPNSLRSAYRQIYRQVAG